MMDISFILVIVVSLIPSKGLSQRYSNNDTYVDGRGSVCIRDRASPGNCVDEADSCSAWLSCMITYEDVKHVNLDRSHIDTAMGKYLNYPALQFEPNPDNGLIYYIKSGHRIPMYTDRLETFVARYKSYYDYSNIAYCSMYSGYRPEEEWNRPCWFNTMNFGKSCVMDQGFGFDDGQPCIALYLDRILNWLPEPYTNDTVPDKIRNEWQEYAVTVHCEGEDPVTIDNMGDVTYYPPSGFHFKYFPNTGQQSWMSPVVYVKLMNPGPAIALNIKCSVYAKNIKRDDQLNTGKVSIDILID